MWYEIQVEGQLAQTWERWFDHLRVTEMPDGTTCLQGPLPDQAALHGLLARIRDLGLTLLSLHRIEHNLQQQYAAKGEPSNEHIHGDH
ncbi:MAG: hypothetical protein JXC32_14325 [Anaerolineae bacterium]|nr:hypothetical protein [Anaerolineae bacterium]